nr:MobF family relaxase [uncultured Draconibacterium sp.]
MIRMIQSTNGGHAKSYFNDALSKGDYYMDDQELGGQFHGKVADRLGLTGAIEKNDFYRLCENINPKTGEKLTPRNKTNRTVGYDINFHCPKSVSVLNALGDDKRVMDAFRSSVHDTMQLIEADAKTRVRKNGKMEERDTGELIWGEFVHQTARPVDNSAPDPHLHAHCFVINTTWDNQEEKFKAGQFRDIKRDMPYYQACFQKTLSDKLNAIGYTTRVTDKAFELDVIPEKAIEVFSKRTDAIGRFAKEKNITNKAELDSLGARTRAKKEKGYTMQELRSLWHSQVEHIAQDKNGGNTDNKGKSLTPEQCVNHALEHCFERHSVVQDRVLLSTAISYAMQDPSLSPDAIRKSFANDSRIIKVKDRTRIQCTTLTVHAEEKRMIELARQTKGKFIPVDRHADNKSFESLNPEQSRAVRHVLKSVDGITIIRGGAGTGKTTLMKQAFEAIEDKGLNVYAFAPSSEAARDVLRSEGFDNADTVAKLLLDKTTQEQTKGQVIWIDEAGLLSSKDMVSVLELAKNNNARLVLSGDTRQHSSVRRGDALRILRDVGDIKVAGVSRIYRQKTQEYKDAVADISQGKIEQGFERLNKLGSIKEKAPYEVTDELVKDYLECRDMGKSALIIAPTHAQGEEVSDKIRQGLKERGTLDKKERPYTRLKNKNLTNAEKRDVRKFNVGDVVQFHQNVKGVKKGAKLEVCGITQSGVELKNDDDTTLSLPVARPEVFDVYTAHELNVSKGDTIRITKNGFDKNRTRLDNGKVLMVKGFDRGGNIKAVSVGNVAGKEILLDKNYGNINHGYVMTSHASQGKTVDRVFIAQPSATFPASNAKQFYVSVSRGREEVKIYTDSKDDLLDHIAISGDRLSATELSKRHTHEFEQRINTTRAREQFSKEKDEFIKPKNNDRDLEI